MRIIIFLLLLFIVFPVSALAWDDCPHGEVDCPSPGECSRYIDIDEDGICDHSQPAPENRNNTTTDISSSNEILGETEENSSQSRRTYNLLPISLLLIVLYAISHILSKKKIINIINHRKIWNILLLSSFLISGILGILLVIEINFDIVTILPFNVLFWHVEAGIAMFIISIFHILWHWAYFKNMVRVNR